MIPRPHQITDRHLRRRAIAYLRQSSVEQVRENTGSTALQYDLKLLLHNWGWPLDQIDVIDGDLGVSGSVPGLRNGFSDVLARMEAGIPGVVAVTDTSRLTRNLLDFAQFATVATRRDVLLLTPERAVDFRDADGAFIGSLLGLTAIRDNRARSVQNQRARRKKAETGIVTTPPPTGFVRVASGWDKHPDLKVRDAFDLIFDKYDALGSARRVVRWLNTQDVRIPARARHGQIRWVRATTGRIYRILRHPAYAGIYVYGQTILDESGDRDVRGRPRRRPQPPSEWVYLEGHHPAYVTPARWAAIQARLTSNQVAKVSPIGRGEALLQGFLRCAQHGRRVFTQYGGRQRVGGAAVVRVAAYRCQPGSEHANAATCFSIRAARVDGIVEAEILSTLAPHALEALDEAVREAARQYEALRRTREDDLRRADHGVADAERAYDETPATQNHAKDRLLERWNEALARRAVLRDADRLRPLIPPVGLQSNEQDELRRVLVDLPHLWRHPRVSPDQRKRIVRTVLSRVAVTVTPDGLQVDLQWVGGAQTVRDIATVEHVRTVIRAQYAAGWTDREIAEYLHARGVVERRGLQAGQPVTEAGVAARVLRLQLQQPFTRAAHAHIAARTEAYTSARVIAEELNTAGIRHRRGPWTEWRVDPIRRRLRLARTAEGPARLDGPPLAERVQELAREGASPGRIARTCRSEGYRTARGRLVSHSTVWYILRGHRGATPRVSPAARAHLLEWGTSATDEEMAHRLNALALLTERGTPWTPGRIQLVRLSLGINRLPHRRCGQRQADRPDGTP